MHTLPASTFAPRDERERLMAVFADAVYEQGYALTRLSDVARRAALAPEEVARYWATEEDCAVDTLDTAAEQVFSRVAEAFMSTPGDCPLAAHQALDALLRHLAGMPALVHLAVIEFPHLNERTRARMTSYAKLFTEFLGPGFAALPFEPPEPETIGKMIAGGVLGVLREHAVQQRIDELPARLPALSYVCVSTFFGIDEARRVLGLADRAPRTPEPEPPGV